MRFRRLSGAVGQKSKPGRPEMSEPNTRRLHRHTSGAGGGHQQVLHREVGASRPMVRFHIRWLPNQKLEVGRGGGGEFVAFLFKGCSWVTREISCFGESRCGSGGFWMHSCSGGCSCLPSRRLFLFSLVSVPADLLALLLPKEWVATQSSKRHEIPCLAPFRV